jgi:hypothetical protein
MHTLLLPTYINHFHASTVLSFSFDNIYNAVVDDQIASAAEMYSTAQMIRESVTRLHDS